MVAFKSIPKPGKFRNKKVRDAEGKITADSKVERAYFTKLSLEEKAGLIKDIKHWDTVQLLPFVRWKLDYSYTLIETGERVWVDVKGMETGEFRRLKQVWQSEGPGLLQIVKFDSKSKKWVVQNIRPKHFKKMEVRRVFVK